MQDPTKRATIPEVLADEWLRENGCASDTPLDKDVISKIKNFANLNKLKKEALRVRAPLLQLHCVPGPHDLKIPMPVYCRDTRPRRGIGTQGDLQGTAVLRCIFKVGE